MIIHFQGESFKTLASYQWAKMLQDFDLHTMQADDVQSLDPGTLPEPLQDGTLLLPLYIDEDQIGAIVLGNPENGVYYSAIDIDSILYPADRIADAIHAHQREQAHLDRIAELTRDLPARTKPLATENRKMYQVVERALRNLDDFAKLGDFRAIRSSSGP